MLSYYAIYRTSTSEPPVGIFAMETAQGHALIWDHEERAWAYDPALAVRFLDDPRNWDAYRTVDRETAEQMTPEITGGENLPDEESIRWVFQWKGDPPQNDD